MNTHERKWLHRRALEKRWAREAEAQYLVNVVNAVLRERRNVCGCAKKSVPINERRIRWITKNVKISLT
jgi:hypothetical protein